MKPIVITPGEPAGIGPDIVLALRQHKITTPLVVIADRELLEQRGQLLNRPGTLPDYDEHDTKPPAMTLLHVPLNKLARPGDPNIENADYVMRTLTQATQGCLHQKFSALVTGPVNKSIMQEAGIDFSGHTELLATLTHVNHTVMMLAAPQLRIALLTTHIPLSAVPTAITPEKLSQCIEIIDHDLKNKFNIIRPRILVCGLNPHAGEAGHFGKEETTIIIPTLDRLKQKGLRLIGPVSADTAFTAQRQKECDVVLTMYHDQGLPVIKSHGFGNIVNVTLGLPIVRTSVDHGTAFDLAGTGKANESSLFAAIQMAERMTRSN